MLAAAIALSGCAPSPRTQAEPAAGRAYFGDVTPPKDNIFRFNNGAEPEMIDPGLMSGQPDGRVARILFEGLVTPDPRTLEPLPGQAYRWETSDDGMTYTFHLRPGLAWTDGTPLTAHDFVWSWVRVLSPRSGSRYASLLYVLENGEAFNKGEITDSTRLGVHAPDDSTLVVRLAAPTSYFVYLTQYYTCLPVPRHVVEKHGVRWTRLENIVTNGPFKLKLWKANDRFEFVPNRGYWDAASVKLDGIVAYAVDDLNTSVNLYKAGVIDWNPSGYIPSPFIPYLRDYADYRHGPYHGIYFYSVNTKRPPFDNPKVRRALNLAVDRVAIARDLLRGSREPWGNFTPKGYPGYVHPPGVSFDPERARALLAEAGYPGGKGFPKIEILFNTSEDHRRIAEAIQAMWKRELSIGVDLANQEWGSYLQATVGLKYDVARRSWIGDYLDPSTFLQLMMSGDGNNRTGWSNARYDALMRAAALELDAAKRMELMNRAEAVLLEEGPIIPFYHYSTTELLKPYVRGLYQTALDTHPLKGVWIDHAWRRKEAVADAANRKR